MARSTVLTWLAAFALGTFAAAAAEEQSWSKRTRHRSIRAASV